MCEYVSVVATVKGPLRFYAEPSLKSHGNARLGWKFNGGAEVEWTSENHGSLSVRYEDEKLAAVVKQMIVERFNNRSEFIASITEARDTEGRTIHLCNGRRIFTAEDGGPNFEELNELLEKLPMFPWFAPTADCNQEILEQLVAQHLYELGMYSKDAGAFDGVTLRIVDTPAAWDAARDAARAAAWDAAWDAARAAAWAAARDAARDAAWDAARDAARDAAWDAAWAAARDAARDAAWDAAWDAARDAARAAAWDAAHLVAGLQHNPWAPLVEICALGAVPIGVIDDEFVVFVPGGCAA